MKKGAPSLPIEIRHTCILAVPFSRCNLALPAWAILKEDTAIRRMAWAPSPSLVRWGRLAMPKRCFQDRISRAALCSIQPVMLLLLRRRLLRNLDPWQRQLPILPRKHLPAQLGLCFMDGVLEVIFRK